MLPLATDPTWWDDLIDFLTTPEQVIPAGIAVAALVLGIVNLVRSLRSTPKPNLRISAELGHMSDTVLGKDDEPVEVVPLHINMENRGDATAHDIRVSIGPNNDGGWTSNFPMIEPGKTYRRKVYVDASGDPTGLLTVKYKRGPSRGIRVKYGWETP